MVLYDCKSSKEIADLSFIANCPVLFIANVYYKDLSEGEWHKIGNLPLEEYLKKEPAFFIKQIWPKGSADVYTIYENGESRNATFVECKGIEPMSVYNSYNIENRLNDIYYGNLDKRLKEYLSSR